MPQDENLNQGWEDPEARQAREAGKLYNLAAALVSMPHDFQKLISMASDSPIAPSRSLRRAYQALSAAFERHFGSSLPEPTGPGDSMGERQHRALELIAEELSGRDDPSERAAGGALHASLRLRPRCG
jgi:hypothetical protein